MNWRSPRPYLRRHRGFTGSGGGGIGQPLLEPNFIIDASLGNDTTGDGSLGNPWKTFGKAATEMAGSSTKRTYARGGTYNAGSGETFPISLTSSHNNIAFHSYPNETAILDRGNTNGAIFDLNGCNDLLLKGLKLQNVIGTSFTDGITITVAGNCDRGIIEGCTADNHHIFWKRTGGTIADWKILGNTFTDIETFGFFTEGGPMSGWTVAGNTYTNSGSNITSPSTATAFFHAYVVQNCIFEYNLAQDIGYGFLVFISTNGALTGNKIRYNIIKNVAFHETFDNEAGALYTMGRNNASQSGTEWHDNWIQTVGASHTLLAKALYADDGADDLLIYNNVLIDCWQASVHIHGGDNNSVTNNIMVLVEGASRAWSTDQRGIFHQEVVQAGADGTGNVYSRNIVLSVNSSFSPTPYDATNAASQWILKSGTIPDPTADGNIKWENIPDYTSETNPVNSDPGFADPSNLNFFLSSLPGSFTHIAGVTDTNASGPPSTWGLGGYNRANY